MGDVILFDYRAKGGKQQLQEGGRVAKFNQRFGGLIALGNLSGRQFLVGSRFVSGM